MFIRRSRSLLLALSCALALAGCSGNHNAAPAVLSAPAGSMNGPNNPAAARAMDKLFPKSVSPGSIKPRPMPHYAKLAPQVMIASTPSRRIRPASIGPLAWTELPGSARQVVPSPDGSIYALSTAGPDGADYYIWQYSNGTWSNLPGAGAQIAVGPDGTLYAVNGSTGAVYSFDGVATWTGLGGGANWVTVGADGGVYVLSNSRPVGTNTAIWEYHNGQWNQFPGEGTQLAGSWDGNTYAVAGLGTIVPNGFYVINSNGNIYYYSPGNGYVAFPGAAGNIAPGIGGVFVLGYPPPPGGGEIYYYDFTSSPPLWIAEPGNGVNLGALSPTLVIVNSVNGIWTSSLSQPAYHVKTVAGVPGTEGEAGGQPLNGATFNWPSFSTFDGSGNLYTVDSLNNLIRETNFPGPNPQVITVAGGGNPNQCDPWADGPGGMARFCEPGGIVYGPDGNFYVADTLNYVIRKVTPGPNSTVSTIAGVAGQCGFNDGPGNNGGPNPTAAQFCDPYDLAFDAAGNLYVADSGNNTIRLITNPTGSAQVITIAGQAPPLACGSSDGQGTAASFCGPQGLAFDQKGNLYVSDSLNCTLRKIVPSAGNTVFTVSTLAGSVNSCPGANDGTGAGASFNIPQGLRVDGTGNIFMADAGNNTIREISPSGSVTTIAGSALNTGTQDGTGAAALFNGPTGIALDGSGNIYVTDTLNSTIREVSPH